MSWLDVREWYMDDEPQDQEWQPSENVCPKCGASVDVLRYYGETGWLEEECGECLYCGWYWQYSYGNYDEGYRAELGPAVTPVEDIPF